MVKLPHLLIILLTACSCIEFVELDDFLPALPDPNRTYVLIFTSQYLQKQGGLHMNRMSYQPSGDVVRADIKRPEFKKEYFGIEHTDLPQIRIMRNGGEIYTPQLHKLDFDFEWYPDQLEYIVANEHLQQFDRKLNLPLSSQEIGLRYISHKNLYIKALYSLLGVPIQYEPLIAIGVLFAMGAVVGFVVQNVGRFLKQNGEQSLTTRHAATVLVFWGTLQMMLFPNIEEDFHYHHQWKIVTNNLPLSRWYDNRPQELDYPPLFAYLQLVEGAFLGLFFPLDLKPGSLHKESDGFRVAMAVVNMVVNSSLWFALLKLFRTLQAVGQKEKKRVTVNLFAFCFLNPNLLFIDGARNQSNSMTLALTILSMAYILQHRYLLSAFWYCVALNTKQLAVYYSLAYFLYLLIVYGLTPSFNFKNLFKLASLVIGFHALLYLPFVSSFDKMLFNMTKGGYLKLPGAPNLPNLYTFLQILVEFKYTRSYRIPLIGKAVIFVGLGAMLGKFIYSRRQNAAQHFPLFAFLSSLVFFNILDLIHSKHVIYVEAPLIIYGAVVGGGYLKAASRLQIILASFQLAKVRFAQRFSFRHPLQVVLLFHVKAMNPEMFKYVVWEYLGVEVPCDILMLFFQERDVTIVYWVLFGGFLFVLRYKLKEVVLGVAKKLRHQKEE